MVSLDFTFVLFTLTFLVFVFVLKFVFFDPTENTISRRDKAIQEDIDKAKRFKSKIESEFTVQDPKKILQDAKFQANTYIDQVLSETNANRDLLLKEREVELKDKVSKQISDFAIEFRSLETQLQSEVPALVDLVIQKIFDKTKDSIQMAVK